MLRRGRLLTASCSTAHVSFMLTLANGELMWFHQAANSYDSNAATRFDIVVVPAKSPVGVSADDNGVIFYLSDTTTCYFTRKMPVS